MTMIKLFSGMDFSGKSTTISYLAQSMPGLFKCRYKFLTPIPTLQYMIENNIWIPRDKFIPLLRDMVVNDINHYEENGPILQDTLWVIKFTAKLLVEDRDTYKNEIYELLRLVKGYPEADSFYITASAEERKRRYEIRKLRGERISKSDKLLFSGNMFEKVDRQYREIIFERFPYTQIIDTTSQTPEEIVRSLQNNKRFMSDLQGGNYGTAKL